MPSRAYLLSLPERVIRSALGLSAGLLREVSEVVLPAAVRRTQLYQSLVDTTLRFVIERVAGAKDVYAAEQALPDDFLMRRGAGNAIELLGIVAFRVSPVWVLAALADLSGLGRRLIPEIADALKAEGLLETETDSRAWTSCSMVWRKRLRAWPRLSTRLPSMCQRCAVSGMRFAPRPAA